MQNMPNQQNQALDSDIVDIGRGKRGWYPRWWLLSAMLINAIAIICYLCWSYIPCHAQDPNSFDMVGYVCDNVSRMSLPLWMQIGAIWLFFLLGWLMAYLFGMRPLERLERRGPIAQFLRNISNFNGLRRVLVIYGGLTGLFIIVLMLARRLQPVPFALGAIVVFVGICAFFYNPVPQRRAGNVQQTWADYVRQADSPIRLLHDLFFYGLVGRFTGQGGQNGGVNQGGNGLAGQNAGMNVAGNGLAGQNVGMNVGGNGLAGQNGAWNQGGDGMAGPNNGLNNDANEDEDEDEENTTLNGDEDEEDEPDRFQETFELPDQPVRVPNRLQAPPDE